MTQEQMEQLALSLMREGRNCAETVLCAACADGTIDSGRAPMRIATGFGGGVGATLSEMCGALAGGVMAIGLAVGRDEPGKSSGQAQRLTVELRRRFIAAHGSSNCGVLRARFGEQKDWEQCQRLTAQTAALVAALLEEGRRALQK